MATITQPLRALAGGRYTIQRALSEGGMGALYLANDHEAFGRAVVLKTTLADPTASPAEQHAAQARFMREARTLAALRFPTIPQIYSCFEDGGRTYIAMEYIEGTDLSAGLSRADEASRQRTQGRPYPLASVVRWGIGVCRILEYLAACAPPVVHQDVKPANLILANASGELYLVDFGAARGRFVSAPGGGKTAIFGTPGYAAPEQFQGQSEPKSDVYALAATLYHLATDDDPADHVFDFPRLPHLGYLGGVLGRALQISTADRLTATELREQLEALHRPEGGRPLRAPDGAALYDRAELASWCERNWGRAADWLYGGLPDQVDAAWVQPDLARSLRGWAAPHAGDRNAGLDAALAGLDPQGFGLATPALSAPAQLDLDTFVVTLPVPRRLAVRNTGRRYTALTVAPPPWLRVRREGASLCPGEQAEFSFKANWRARPGRVHDGTLLVRAGEATLLSIPVVGEPVTGGTRGRRNFSRQQALAVTALVGTAFLLALALLVLALL